MYTEPIEHTPSRENENDFIKQHIELMVRIALKNLPELGAEECEEKGLYQLFMESYEILLNNSATPEGIRKLMPIKNDDEAKELYIKFMIELIKMLIDREIDAWTLWKKHPVKVSDILWMQWSLFH